MKVETKIRAGKPCDPGDKKCRWEADQAEARNRAAEAFCKTTKPSLHCDGSSWKVIGW